MAYPLALVALAFVVLAGAAAFSGSAALLFVALTGSAALTGSGAFSGTATLLDA